MLKRWRPAAQLAGVALALSIAALVLRDRLPAPAEVAASVRLAEPRWLLVAGLAELVSVGMFARQQRRLLTAFGVTMARYQAFALAYSRSAIAIAMPAGTALSAAYAFRQFRTSGASRAVAGTVMVLSGLVSMAALALLYLSGALAAGVVHLAAAWRAHPVLVEGAVALTVAFALLVVFLLRPTRRSAPRPREPRAGARYRLAARAPRLAGLLRPVGAALHDARSVGGRHWALALAAATANWFTDLLCLYAATRALHLPVSLPALGAVYLTVQLVRQVPLTPGGIGVIEISLLAGLISTGAAEAPATAAVLVYRLFSCWLVLPIGLLGALVLRRRRPAVLTPDSGDPAEPARPLPDTPSGPRPVPLGCR
ncbi:MAG: YbhN family protein [Labedaea sp.]